MPAQIRREAVLAGDMTRAWDASSAAAGALMLGAKARDRHSDAAASCRNSGDHAAPDAARPRSRSPRFPRTSIARLLPS